MSKQSKSNVQDDDPGRYYSSEGEEDIDYQNDTEEPQAKVHTHRFTIDLVLDILMMLMTCYFIGE
mgnify:CR=1 FL=1